MNLEEALKAKAQVGILATLGPSGEWVQFCEQDPTPDGYPKGPDYVGGPGWYVCVQADADGGLWWGPYDTREEAQQAGDGVWAP